MPQHLTCVRAAKLISHAHVAGDTVGSAELFFSPDRARSGYYLFDIGTASSTSRITEHLLTNLWVIGLFHKYVYAVEGEPGNPGIVRINTSENKSEAESKL
jgi:RNA 3'-terminal phosphate cyclase